jgi:hypothetical protein
MEAVQAKQVVQVDNSNGRINYPVLLSSLKEAHESAGGTVSDWIVDNNNAKATKVTMLIVHVLFLWMAIQPLQKLDAFETAATCRQP